LFLDLSPGEDVICRSETKQERRTKPRPYSEKITGIKATGPKTYPGFKFRQRYFL
jgi:hypothetical protein